MARALHTSVPCENNLTRVATISGGQGSIMDLAWDRFAPASECTAGQRGVFWSDDDQQGGHAIRRGWLPCGSLL
jgi:hypothetical protein